MRPRQLQQSLRPLSAAVLLALAACESRPDTARQTESGPPRPALHVLAGLTDSGVVEQPITVDSSPGPYFEAGRIYADAQAVATAIFLGTVVGIQENQLTVDSRPTTIPARIHGSMVYAPVRELARELGAYTAVGPDSLHITLWPAPVLCEYRKRADTSDAVYRGARAEDLFAGCRR